MLNLAKRSALTLVGAILALFGTAVLIGGVTYADQPAGQPVSVQPKRPVPIILQGGNPHERCVRTVSPGYGETFEQEFARLVECEKPSWEPARQKEQVSYLVGALQESLPCYIDWHDLSPGLSVRVIIPPSKGVWSFDLRNSGLEHEC